MEYCPDCGEKLNSDAQFCQSCGTEVLNVNGTADPAPVEEDQPAVEDEGVNTGLAVASSVMGIIVGAVVAFAFTNVGGAAVFFFITLGGVAYWLYRRDESVKETIGMGLYITALWMPLSPIIFYIPLAGSADTETAAGSGQAIGSVLGMFIYGFIGLVIGIVLAAVGYFLRR